MARFLVFFLGAFFLNAAVYAEQAQHSPSEKSPRLDSSATTQRAELDAIEAALAKREDIFAAAWTRQLETGKLTVDTAEMEKALREAIQDLSDLTPEKRDQMVERLRKGSSELLRKLAAKNYFDAYYRDLKVKGFYDLSGPGLPEDLKRIVDYFKKEYGQDVTSARVVLVDGLPLGRMGTHIGTRVSQASTQLQINTGDKKVDGVISARPLSGVVADTMQKIFGSKDVILVNAKLFQARREDAANIIAHELRHMLDQNTHAAAFADFERNKQQLEKKMAAEGQQMVAQEQKAFSNSKELHNYIEAARTVNLKKDPTLANDAEFQKFIKGVGEDAVKDATKDYPQDYVYRMNEYERRGYVEQARYARVAQGWTAEKYLRSLTHDMPLTVISEENSDVTLPSGEKVTTAIIPNPPWLIRYYLEPFESQEKVQVDR